jgi:hypothetical protein
VNPDVPEAHVDRMWSDINAAYVHPRPWRGRLLLACGALATTAAVWFAVVALWHPATTLTTLDAAGAEFATGEAPRTAQLADGSLVELMPGSSLRLAAQSHQQMLLELDSGEATFEVTRRPTRTFMVSAHGVIVRVVGTRFTVRERGAQVEVIVHHGIVEVDHDGQTERLYVGDHWLSPLPAHPEPVEQAVKAPPATPVPAKAPRQIASAAPPRRAPVPQAPPSADALFASALEARHQNRVDEAARLLQAFIAEFESDSRAPVAALELARIQLDSLHDARAAAASLELSLRLDPSASFREEAMSRTVRAYDEAHDPHACAEARDAYLRSFPSGAYVSSVRSRCGH